RAATEGCGYGVWRQEQPRRAAATGLVGQPRRAAATGFGDKSSHGGLWLREEGEGSHGGLRLRGLGTGAATEGCGYGVWGQEESNMNIPGQAPGQSPGIHSGAATAGRSCFEFTPDRTRVSIPTI